MTKWCAYLAGVLEITGVLEKGRGFCFFTLIYLQYEREAEERMLLRPWGFGGGRSYLFM